MIGLIVARSKNNVIGKYGKIPWNTVFFILRVTCIN